MHCVEKIRHKVIDNHKRLTQKLKELERRSIVNQKIKKTARPLKIGMLRKLLSEEG